MATDDTDFAYFGLSHLANGRGKRDGIDMSKTNPLVDHLAVRGYRTGGVSTDDLTSFIESFVPLVCVVWAQTNMHWLRARSLKPLLLMTQSENLLKSWLMPATT